MQPLPDRIAETVLRAIDGLPAKYKPVTEPSGLSNWVPSSGIALVDAEENVEVVAVATGMKCLPSISISSLDGLALHDCHAEVIAIRLFNYFLLRECQQVLNSSGPLPYQSPYIRRTNTAEFDTTSYPPPFEIRDKWQIWMYCSEAPCGDASMELIMEKQEDATPWISAQSGNVDSKAQETPRLLGRGQFSELGVVRRKPARGDSPPTLSKSCTDKLAMKQCTSMLSSPASLLVLPSSAYLHALILPESQYVAKACERAFGPTGRMQPICAAEWAGGYSYRPFEVVRTNHEFRYSRRADEALKPRAGPQSKPSNIAAAVSSAWGSEVIINGILQGRKKGDERGASMLSRRKMAALVLSTMQASQGSGPDANFQELRKYSDIKASPQLKSRMKVKEEVIGKALRGWVVNETDDFPVQRE